MAAWRIERRDERLLLGGELRFADAAPIWRALGAEAERAGLALDVDLGGASAVDSSIMALLVELRASLLARGVRCEIVNAARPVAALVRLFHGDELPRARATSRRDHGIARLGAATERLLGQAHRVVALWGEVVAALGGIIRRPATASWRAVPALAARAGADGIPIVLVLNFLVGFVMAFQTARQLKLFGANIFAADIVGLSVARELAPLMTAIISCGRSGAAFAAELGTMQVSEEIDALRTMGFMPIPYLVVPRIVTLAIVAPVLTLLGDVVGVAGGAVVSSMILEITPTGFLSELRTVLVASDVWTGLVKSVAFGVAIAFIGCQQGLAARGAASGVGRGTTATVVYCLFAIVILDTLFTIVYRGLGV